MNPKAAAAKWPEPRNEPIDVTSASPFFDFPSRSRLPLSICLSVRPPKSNTLDGGRRWLRLGALPCASAALPRVQERWRRTENWQLMSVPATSAWHELSTSTPSRGARLHVPCSMLHPEPSKRREAPDHLRATQRCRAILALSCFSARVCPDYRGLKPAIASSTLAASEP